MVKKRTISILSAAAIFAVAVWSGPAGAAEGGCNVFGNGNSLHPTLEAALQSAVDTETSGLDFDMWATIVARDGTVCAVARSAQIGAQWPGSRIISAQKANTANAFSLDALALSTANLYSAVQPGGSLFGLQASNPVDPTIAYDGPYSNLGTKSDPLVGKRVGGVNVFGGGLALYIGGEVVGAVGASGDTSCADHMIAWRVRYNLGYDQMTDVGGVSGEPTLPDNIIYDLPQNNSGTTGGNGLSASGFGHPRCLNTGDESALPAVQN